MKYNPSVTNAFGKKEIANEAIKQAARWRKWHKNQEECLAAGTNRPAAERTNRSKTLSSNHRGRKREPKKNLPNE